VQTTAFTDSHRQADGKKKKKKKRPFPSLRSCPSGPLLGPGIVPAVRGSGLPGRGEEGGAAELGGSEADAGAMIRTMQP
jgi:hypothetical protein